MSKYLEHCLTVEAGSQAGREEGLFWPDPPSVGKLVQKIIEDHEQNIAAGRVEKGLLVNYICSNLDNVYIKLMCM